MLNSRKELYDAAKKLYLPLYERAANRYVRGDVYDIVDTVGFECTRLEELFRPLWGIAPFLSDPDFNITVEGKTVRVADFITNMIYEGTSEDSPRRFDKSVSNVIEFANQSITELTAYLVAVHFAPEPLWLSIEEKKRERIAAWIHKYALIALKNSWPNNHYWYPVLSIEILKQLGYHDASADEALKFAYGELEELYIGNGWYCDGKDFGRFDFYEAWAHHTYTLLWILVGDKSAPDYEDRCARYRERSEQFLSFYSHYFDSDGGMCAHGRSLSYRFAAVSAFGLAALVGCKIDLGLAKSIILKNVSYFLDKSLPPRDGCFSCGYLYDSTRFAENYASDGASTCYTEGFMCLLADEEHPLWLADGKKLHIEEGDYLLECPAEKLDFLLQGEADFGGVTLFNNAIHYMQRVNSAFNDMCGYYSKFCYNSRAGFAISTRDKPGFDNMISLATEDMLMTSLRGRVNTVYSSKELLVSYHIPFTNDPETKITTYTVPLTEGYHVRVHKVELSRPYIVREGGFTIGMTDDSYNYDGGVLTYGDTVSRVRVFSDTKTSYRLERIHPGMHNLRPHAYYPTWTTGDSLSAGTYIFATSVFFSTEKSPANHPEIEIEGTRVKIKYGNYEKELVV